MLRVLCIFAAVAGAASATAEPAAAAASGPAVLDGFSLAQAGPKQSPYAVTDSAAVAAVEATWVEKNGDYRSVKVEFQNKPFKLTADADVRMRDVPRDFSRVGMTGATAGN